MMVDLVRVAVIDDRRLFREALSARLSTENGIALAASTSGLRELVQIAKTQPIDIVLVDLSGGPERGITMIWDVKSYLTDARVIALGIDSHESTILKCVEAGASGFLAADTSYSALLNTIDQVYAGQTPCSHQILIQVITRINELTQQQDETATPQHGGLSARETEIVKLIALGMINKQIAQTLGIKLSTVKNHVHNILQKLQVQRRQDTVQRAVELGILQRQSDTAQDEYAEHSTVN